MKIPKRIKLGAEVYRVCQGKNLTHDFGDGDVIPAYGWVSYQNPRIEVEKGLSPSVKKTAVLHELFHAIIHQAGHGGVDGAFEERLVQALSYGLMSVLHDNPKFAAWITENGKKHGSSSG